MNKTLAWRNAWDVPKDIQDETAALLEKDGTSARGHVCRTEEGERAGTVHFLWQQTDSRRSQERAELQARPDFHTVWVRSR
jgi:peptide/nickel transport system substrate-binding protein